MEEILTLELSNYPELLEMAKLSRSGKVCAMPSIGKPFDKVRVRNCKKTIENNLYLVVLEDDTMFYLLDDINGMVE